MISGKYRARSTIKQLTSNRDYLESSKARDGSYRGGLEAGTASSSASTTPSATATAVGNGTPAATEEEEEEATWCERRCGTTISRWWSQYLDFYYRTMLHRRRLSIITVK